MDQLSSFKIFCKGGLDTSRDALSQGESTPGSAIALINYEPAVTGGYRRIDGYENQFGTVPGTGKVLGVCVATGINDGILAVREPTTTSYIHTWNTTTEEWDEITTPSLTTSGIDRVRFAKFNWSEPKVAIVDGVNPAAVYDGTTYTQITDSNAPSAPKYATVFQNHLFLTGDTDEEFNLYFSAPINETSFSPANGSGVINVGFPIVAVKAFRDALYVFGINNIKKLTGNNIADFVLENITDDLGCLASDSVVEIGGDIYFLSQDGYRPVSGTAKIGDVNLESVSQDIQSVFKDLYANENLATISTVIVRAKSQFRLFVPSIETSGLIAGIRSTEAGPRFEFGQTLGIGATCADSGYIGMEEYVIHGDEDGKVHRQEVGNDFDGREIFSLYQTPFVHMDDPEVRKYIHTISTYLRTESGDNNIVMSVVYDYDALDSLSPTNFTLTTGRAAAYYNEAVYDSTAIFDGNPSPVIRTSVSGSGKSVSVKYVTNDTNASHSIQGIVITFGVGDRR